MGAEGGIPAFTVSAAVTVPTVTASSISVSGATGNGGVYKIGDTVTATWNNSANGDNNSAAITGVTFDFTQFGGGAAVAGSDNGQGLWSRTYTITAGSIQASNRNVAVTATDSAGSTTTSGASNATVDSIFPSVSSITRVGSNPNNAGSDQFTITFSESVTGVDASDFHLTSTGVSGTIAAVTPSSASTYTLTVNGVTGDGTLRLDLNSSGTGIADTAGNAISGGFTNGQTYTVDRTPPAVSSVTTSGAGITMGAGDLNAGSVVTLTETFSETVVVTGGTPTLTLNSGGTATYTGGSNSSALTFTYTVGAGQNTSDLAVAGSNLNSATIRDSAGNDADLTGAVTNPSGTLRIDTTPPTVTAIARVGSNPNNASSDQFAVTFSEAVTWVAAGDFSLTTTNTPGGSAVVNNGINSITTSDFINYVVTIAHVTGDGTLQLGLLSNRTGIMDAAGNGATAAFTNGDVYTIDHTAPVVSSIAPTGSNPNNAGSDTYTVTFSEAVTGVDFNDFTATTSGNVAATGISVTPVSSSVYSVSVNGVTGDGSLRLDLNSSNTGITDTAGNAIATGFNSGGMYTVDHTAPVVTSVAVPGNGTYGIGQNLDFAVNYSEAVTVTGTPKIGLTLDTGGTVYAQYISGSGTSALTFRYSVVGGELDTNGIVLDSAITANNGTIVDTATNAATPTLNNVAPTTGVLVNSIPPTATSINIVDSAINNLTTEHFTVAFSTAVNGVSTNDFTLAATGNVGGTISSVTAVNASTYTVSVTGITGDGTLRLDLNTTGNVITDSHGNILTAAHTGDQSYTIDHTPPAAVTMTVPANSTYGAGQNLDFTTTFGEMVTVDTTGGIPRIALTLDTGGTVYANYVSGTGTNTLMFRYTIASGTQDLTGIVTGTSIDANGGTIRDVATNNAVLAINAVEPSTAGVDVDAIPVVNSSSPSASTSPSSGPDQLTGTAGDDTIAGLAGDDTISGGDGNDLLYGNQDQDLIDAGSGNNTAYGGMGNDSIMAGAGSDLLFGNEGADTINAGDGNNTVVGGQDSTDGADLITAGSGNDVIFGNGGNDSVSAGAGNDSVIGGFGDDVLFGNQGNDIILGNEGNDLIFGGTGDDTLVGGRGDDTLYGNEGNDVLYGNEGADHLVFGTNSGNDLVNGFSSSEGDKLDLQGQTYATTTDANGNAVLALSGGGTVTLAGIAANQVNAGFFA